jgi:hypothetical protein
MKTVNNNAEKVAIAKLEEIQRRPAALNTKGVMTIADMLKRDTKNIASIDILVEQSVDKLYQEPFELPRSLEGGGRDQVSEECPEEKQGHSHFCVSIVIN